MFLPASFDNVSGVSNSFNVPNSSLSFTGNHTNNTDSSYPPIAQWTLLSVLTLITCVTGILGNGGLLLLFARHRTLRSPFNVYIINLLLANFVCVIVQYPMDISTQLHSSLWILGESACTVYVYTTWVLEAACFNAHLLIAINRIWAVVHPFSYRSMHSIRTAVALCAVMWVYVNVIVGSGWLIDTLYYRLPVTVGGCMMNSAQQQIWSEVVQLIAYSGPHFVMLMSLPIIYFTKRFQRRKARRNIVAPTSVTFVREDRNRLEHLPTAVETNISGNITPGQHDPTHMMRARSPVYRVQRRQSSHGYCLLALLTTTVTICWTPTDVYYMLTLVKNFDSPVYYEVATILFTLQTTLDPVMFTMAIKKIKDVLFADIRACWLALSCKISRKP